MFDEETNDKDAVVFERRRLVEATKTRSNEMKKKKPSHSQPKRVVTYAEDVLPLRQFIIAIRQTQLIVKVQAVDLNHARNLVNDWLCLNFAGYAYDVPVESEVDLANVTGVTLAFPRNDLVDRHVSGYQVLSESFVRRPIAFKISKPGQPDRYVNAEEFKGCLGSEKATPLFAEGGGVIAVPAPTRVWPDGDVAPEHRTLPHEVDPLMSQLIEQAQKVNPDFDTDDEEEEEDFD